MKTISNRDQQNTSKTFQPSPPPEPSRPSPEPSRPSPEPSKPSPEPSRPSLEPSRPSAAGRRRRPPPPPAGAARPSLYIQTPDQQPLWLPYW